jgi:hypothetical protein
MFTINNEFIIGKNNTRIIALLTVLEIHVVGTTQHEYPFVNSGLQRLCIYTGGTVKIPER